MATNEQLSDGAVDPNVRIPDHVKAGAAAAEAYYAKAPPADNSAVLPNATPPVHPGLVAPPPATPPATAAVTEPAPTPPPAAEPTNEDWRQRFLSMQGRWKSSQVQLGIVQQQASDLATELTQTQALLAHGGTLQPQNNDHNRVIAPQADIDTYGEELIDTVARTARAAIAPDLQRLENENAELKKSAKSNAQAAMSKAVAAAVPNWRAIQADPRWKQFCSLPNIYTNQLRSQTLKSAWDAGNASQTIALFREFTTELIATGQSVPGATPAAPLAAPHEPAMNLADLAAPGRARPAGGDTPNQSADKPVITRASITQHYRRSREGYYQGRQTEYDATEAAIQAAQREGRIQG